MCFRQIRFDRLAISGYLGKKGVGRDRKEDTTCVDRPESLDGRRLPTGVMDDSPLANIRPEFWLENGGADASPGAHCPFHCFAKTLSYVALLLGKVPMRCDKPMLAKVWQTARVRQLQYQDFSKTDLTAGVQQNLQLASKAPGLTGGDGAFGPFGRPGWWHFAMQYVI
ncbi:hypothetical protein PG984_010470 [Apiospora sp. TS-2023a]